MFLTRSRIHALPAQPQLMSLPAQASTAILPQMYPPSPFPNSKFRSSLTALSSSTTVCLVEISANNLRHVASLVQQSRIPNAEEPRTSLLSTLEADQSADQLALADQLAERAAAQLVSTALDSTAAPLQAGPQLHLLPLLSIRQAYQPYQRHLSQRLLQFHLTPSQSSPLHQSAAP